MIACLIIFRGVFGGLQKPRFSTNGRRAISWAKGGKMDQFWESTPLPWGCQRWTHQIYESIQSYEGGQYEPSRNPLLQGKRFTSDHLTPSFYGCFAGSWVVLLGIPRYPCMFQMTMVIFWGCQIPVLERPRN